MNKMSIGFVKKSYYFLTKINAVFSSHFPPIIIYRHVVLFIKELFFALLTKRLNNSLEIVSICQLIMSPSPALQAALQSVK